MKIKMQGLIIIVLCLVTTTCSEPEDWRIGFLFEDNTGFSQQAFKYAVDYVNEKEILPQFNLVADMQQVDYFDSYKVSQTVCGMLGEGVAGIFGPRSVDTSDHVQSICDAMEIPHVEMRWDSRQRRGSCLVNLFPHPSTMTKVFVDLVSVYEWESFTVVYEDNDGLIRLNGLLTYYDHKGFPVTVRQLDEGDNYRPTLRRIKNANQKNIVLDCSVDILYKVLLHAQQVGLMGAEYSYIITSLVSILYPLDLQTINLEPFMYAGTNITGVRMFNPESNEMQDALNFWQEKGLVLEEPLRVKTESALIHDAVLLYTKSVGQLLQSLEIQPKPLSCDTNDNWDHGYSIINYMKVSEMNGLSGLIKFDHEGFRTDFTLEIIELTSEGLQKKGNWNTTFGVNFTQTLEPDTEVTTKLDLRNMTFVVMISLIDPHAMFKETPTKLEGNDKYEGMAIDVIHELSLMCGFNYTFREQKEGGSGNPDPVTGKWNGMIGEVLSGRADLAIADITITQEREKDADFTLPYMNLGISILYKKPTKSPSLFSFMSPFSNDLWKALMAAYVGISLLMYIVARISPKEWTNPYPCIDEDELEELENQFSLNNSFWFVTGSIMQQGSELAPISVSTRMLASVWWFFTLIIVSSYTANLAAFLTVEQNEEIFRNVEELANQRPNAPVFVKYGAKAGGATEGFFKSSNHSTYQKMWQYMLENYDDVMMKSNRDGVERVLSNADEYAFLMESASIDYEVQRHCELRQVGNPLDSKGYGIVMAKGAWYRNILSSSVIKLQERGKFTQLYKKWWREKRGGGACTDDGDGADAVPLDLDNVGGVFLVLVFGTLFACVIALGELMFEVFIKEDRGPFWKELKRELKFVISCKGTVKKLKASSEDNTSEENSDPAKSFRIS